MVSAETLLQKPGSRVLISGNEAIARGCIEAGVKVSGCYPGTPSSEITDTLYDIADKTDMYVEYSTNEKVAVELAAGAAVTGVRSIASMKSVGLNVAADALVALAYIGVRAGCVVVSADDPECWSSQNEQDNRYYAQLAGIPCLEPSDAQEAKDMTLEAFRLSEKLELPILLRTTTRVNHTLTPVVLGEIEKRPAKSNFVKNPKRFVMIPSNALPGHEILLKKLEQAKEISEESPFNKTVRNGADIGVIAIGSTVGYGLEALDLLRIRASVLKLGMTHPLPSKLILDFMKRFKKVFILEELEPVLENAVRSIAFEIQNRPAILGKLTGHLPRNREYSTKIVGEALANELGKKLPAQVIDGENFKLSFETPSRPPVLCPGCPHRASFYIMRTNLKMETVYCTDIGCYALGVNPPLAVGDILMCMGASVGVAGGISEVQDQPVLSIIGDSTFFHAAIPALINAVNNNHRIVVAVLDNMTTAMTGFQPHPGSIDSKRRGSKVAVEEIAKGCGIKYVRVVDPYNLQETEKALKEASKFPGPSLVVLRHLCSTYEIRTTGRKRHFRVIDAQCEGCQACIKAFGCPAIHFENGRAKIDPQLCSGCGFCVNVCPAHAIEQLQPYYHIISERCVNCQACIKTLQCPAIQVENNQVLIDETLCSGCGFCARLCPSNAIEPAM